MLIISIKLPIRVARSVLLNYHTSPLAAASHQAANAAKGSGGSKGKKKVKELSSLK